MKSYIKHLMPVVALALAFTACDDTNESGFVPADPVPADNMAVYFENTNLEENIVNPGEGNSITVTMSRLNAKEAVTVPLVIHEAAAELNIPTSVEFAAGQTTTSFDITYGTLTPNERYDFDIAVAEGYYHPYKMTEGGYRLTSFVMQAAWDPYKNVVYTLAYKGASKSQTFTATVERLGSLNRYRIPNFLGTGAYFTFYEGDPASFGDDYFVFEPYNGYENYNDGEIDAFYWYDAATGEYPVITLDDGTEIDYLFFLRNWTGYGTYCYISLAKNYGVMWTDICYVDGSYEYNAYITFNFENLTTDEDEDQ